MTRPPSFLSDALGGHRNSLGLIRLLLAVAVLFTHAFPLGGFGADPLFGHTNGQVSIGSLAVGGFFVISGYLITKSAMSTDVLQFAWRRILRLIPAFWVLLAVTALVVGPVLWLARGSQLSTYFRLAPGGPLDFFIRNWNLDVRSFGIFDLLKTSTPYGNAVGYSALNGSIWTLTYEVGCYVLIGILLLFGVFAKARLLIPIVTALLFGAAIVNVVKPGSVGLLLPLISDQYVVTLTLTFMYGACLALYSHKVPFSNGLAILSAVVLLYTLRHGGFPLLGTAAGAYLLMYLGGRLPKSLHVIGAKNDYSYGIYIYGFLVQQLLAACGVYRLGYMPFVIFSIVGSAVCGYLSWHLIEKRAMALKSWGPGRGVKFWQARIRSMYIPGKKDAANSV